MTCTECDPMGFTLVKDASYQVSFLPSGTPSDAEYANNENVKLAEVNDIIIMQDTGDMYQCTVDKNHKKSWLLMYKNVPQVSYIESGIPTDDANAELDNVKNAKEKAVIIVKNTGSQYQLVDGAWMLQWKPQYTTFGSGAPTSTPTLAEVGKQYLDDLTGDIYTVTDSDGGGAVVWVKTGHLISSGFDNDGSLDLNVKKITSDDGKFKTDGNGNLSLNGIELKDISNLTTFDTLLEGMIYFDAKTQRLLIKKDNKMLPLNITNLNLEQQYKLNNGVQMLNFAPDTLLISSGGKSDGNGVNSGYLSFGDAAKTIPVPPTMQIKVTFTLWQVASDFDYHIAGWLNKWNVRVNPAKNTVSVYSGSAKQYEVLCSDLTASTGIKLNDGKAHNLYINVNGGYDGYVSFAIDGEYFNSSYPVNNGSMAELRFRGDENTVTTIDECSVQAIGLSSSQRTKVNKQGNTFSSYDFEGFYPCINSVYTNSKITEGFILKAISNYDALQWLNPYYLNNSVFKNQSIFTSEGMTGGTASFNTGMSIPTFTFECQFKFSSTVNDTTIRRTICGALNYNYSIGLTANSTNKLTIKYHTNPDTEVTLDESLVLDVWHTLAISSNNNLLQVFVDGKLLHTRSFVTNFSSFYIRSLDYNSYVVQENSLIVKNVSLLVGKAKYADKDYDPTLTPTSISNYNINGFFYPLINGRVKNENETSPLVKITATTGSFALRTILSGKISNNYASQPIVQYTSKNTPDIFDTKGASVFVTNYVKDVMKETV